MKAIITEINYKGTVDTKFGEMHKWEVKYDGKSAGLLTKAEKQTYFVEGKESEFTETERQSGKTKYLNIKPITSSKGNDFSRSQKREQIKYSGFAMSYAKDLVVANKIETEQMFPTAKRMIDWMVEQDKRVSNG